MSAILALGDTCRNWEAEFGLAARFAVRSDATLTGTFVLPAPRVSGGWPGAAEEFGLLLQNLREAERRATEAAGSFEAWARGLGVRGPRWQVAEGDLPDVVRQLGNWHDLLVVRNAQNEADVARLGAVALRCGLPTLVAPAHLAEVAPLNCIAVAWNGSAEAARAIHAAQPLLRQARRIVVLSGELPESGPAPDWLRPFDLATYLRQHELPVVHESLRGSGQRAGPALLAAAAAAEADLLVMGAYGRSRFSEWVFGGATRHVLAHAAIPVLLRH
jgi:nucleotide-binding universal stress UspA family protein